MDNITEYISKNKKLNPAQVEELERQLELTPSPSKKLEAWKYFPVKSTALTEISRESKIQDLASKVASIKLEEMDCIVFANGKFIDSLSDKTISGFNETKADDFTFDQDEIETRLDLVTIYSANSGYVINLKDKAKVQILNFVDNGTSFVKNKIKVDKSVEAVVFESFFVSGDSTLNTYSEIDVAQGGHLSYYSNSVCDESARLFSNQKIRVHGGSINSLVLDTDPAHIRRRSEVDLLQENSNVDFKGFYLVNKRAVVNHKLDINHLVPNCESTQLYKGILDDMARVIFDGLVYVAKDAQGTNSEQLNKSTLLSDTAEVDTKPQLEIYADDVACAHGATLGGFNREEIFYLQSRAISQDKAIQMMAFGFAEDVFKHIGLKAIHDVISKQFVDRFADYEVPEDVI